MLRELPNPINYESPAAKALRDSVGAREANRVINDRGAWKLVNQDLTLRHEIRTKSNPNGDERAELARIDRTFLAQYGDKGYEILDKEWINRNLLPETTGVMQAIEVVKETGF